MNADEYKKLIEEALAEDAARDAEIARLRAALTDLVPTVGAILEMIAMMNDTDRVVMDAVSVLQRSVRELQDQAQVPDAG